MKYEEKKACIVGAVSGISPLLVSLVNVDAELIINGFERHILIGYIIKAIGLMILGAFVVFVNSEVDLKKACQLGKMAPAFILGALNTNNLSESKNEVLQLEKELESKNNLSHDKTVMLHKQLSFALINSANAANHELKKGIHNTLSTSKLIWYGVTGNIADGWCVFVGSHKNESDAKKQVKELALRGYDARIYPPFRENKHYGVTIGSYLTIEQARKLKREAIADGLQKDIYLWKWK